MVRFGVRVNAFLPHRCSIRPGSRMRRIRVCGTSSEGIPPDVSAGRRYPGLAVYWLRCIGWITGALIP